MADACENLGQSLLLVGVKPNFGSDFDSIGWWGEIAIFEATWDDALLGKTLEGQFDLMPNGTDICPATMFWECLYGLERFDSKPLWAEAANLVQWRGVDATP